jgi:hypothetical protein
MRAWTVEKPEDDLTLRLLETVNDGSISGLATYHLLKMKLEEIRALPECGPKTAP